MMLNRSQTRDAELLEYMFERESIRCKKKAGAPPPWTNDPILQTYRFTNIKREYDKVTIWIRDNWKKPHADDPIVWFAMVDARLLNEPDSMAAVGYPVPWDPERWTNALRQREADGLRCFNPAYQIGTGSKKAPDGKIAFLRDHVLTPIWRRRDQITKRLQGATLAQAANVFSSCPGFAGFMTGQVIHDLKWAPILKEAPDWWTWAISGPGSRRGMNRLLGRHVDESWDEGEWLDELRALRRRLNPQLEAVGLPKLCAQNVQHNLCEVDKYWRAQAGEGTPKQRYRPTAM